MTEPDHRASDELADGTRRGAFLCLLAALCFGASAPAASRLADDTPAVLLAGILYAGAALATAPYCIRHPISRTMLLAERTRLLAAVLAGGIAGPVLLVAGLSRTDAATASLLLNLELVATIALAATLFREHLGRRVLGGTALVTAAAVALTWQGGARPETGALLIAAACACWGVDNSVTARIENLAPAHITFVKGIVAGTTNVIVGLLLGAGATSAFDAAAGVVVGMIGYGLSITLWVSGARLVGAARAQIIFATAPFIGAAIAWTVLHEQVRSVQLAAVALAAGGVALTLRSSHEHGHAHRPVTHEHAHAHDIHHDHQHSPEVAAGSSHTHRHTHRPLDHAHPHVPDLHHRHGH